MWGLNFCPKTKTILFFGIINKIIRKDQKIILENWGQPGPEAIYTQAAALRYAIRVHLKHLDQFENAKKIKNFVIMKMRVLVQMKD